MGLFSCFKADAKSQSISSTWGEVPVRIADDARGAMFDERQQLRTGSLQIATPLQPQLAPLQPLGPGLMAAELAEARPVPMPTEGGPSQERAQRNADLSINHLIDEAVMPYYKPGQLGRSATSTPIWTQQAASTGDLDSRPRPDGLRRALTGLEGLQALARLASSAEVAQRNSKVAVGGRPPLACRFMVRYHTFEDHPRHCPAHLA